MYKDLWGLQKSSEVLYDLWLWSQEFCCYDKLHHQQLVAGGGGGVWSSCENGIGQEFKISQRGCV